MKISIIILLLSIGSLGNLAAQKQDYNWLFGSAIEDNFNIELQQDTTWGCSIMSFDSDPVHKSFLPNQFLDFSSTSMSISDKETGELLFYSNGQEIHTLDGAVRESINLGDMWDWFSNADETITYGSPYFQTAICLPDPSNEVQYFFLYQNYDPIEFFSTELRYSLLNLDSSSLLIKDEVLQLDDTSQGGLTAVQHANGRDWWITTPSNNLDYIHIYLLNADGLNYSSRFETNLNIEYPILASQATFSPNGNDYIINALPNQVNIDDTFLHQLSLRFDRCLGNFEFHFRDSLPYTRYDLSSGIAFSQNGQFAYISNGIGIYRYEFNASNAKESRELMAQYDGYQHEDFWDTTLGYMMLAPDGKIYLTTGTNSSDVFHVINEPEEEDPQISQHSVKIPTVYFRGLPNNPYWRLGPVDGSVCDSLGIDNIPAAKYRVADTLDDLTLQFKDLSYYEPETWFWDFGDNTTSTEVSPSHTFESTGTYEVCLEVSNSNGSDSYCRSITIETSSASELHGMTQDISIYPNPTTDYMIIESRHHNSTEAYEISDVHGKLIVSSQLSGKTTTVETSTFAKGIYFIRFVTDGDLQSMIRFVKI